jgi:hypothetical protein
MGLSAKVTAKALVANALACGLTAIPDRKHPMEVTKKSPHGKLCGTVCCLLERSFYYSLGVLSTFFWLRLEII